ITRQEIKKYNIIFIGTPDFSVPTLEALIANERFNIAAFITAPDALVGRKQILTPPPVKVMAQKFNLPVLQPRNIKAMATGIKKIAPDAIIVIAYGQIIPPDILAIPKYSCLNLHASLLPKHRGASPIQSAIAAGDKTSGVTLMKMDSGLDTGPIIAQKKIKINNCHFLENGDPTDNRRDSRLRGNDNLDTGASLHDKLARLSAKTLLQYLPGYLAGKLQPKPQTENQAPYAPKLTRQSGRIDCRKPAEEIQRLVGAYYPWPGTWTKWNGKVLKIIEVDDKILKINNYQIGQTFLNNNELAIQCGQDSLLIKKLQIAGKQIVDSPKFILGYKKITRDILR